jgi:hypothetical protein
MRRCGCALPAVLQLQERDADCPVLLCLLCCSSKNVTLGVPRLTEIINRSTNIKTPSLSVYLPGAQFPEPSKDDNETQKAAKQALKDAAQQRAKKIQCK